MLLLKYEKFAIVSKDSFLEELVFKFEKNIQHFSKIEQKGRLYLKQLSELTEEAEEIKSKFEEINALYVKIQETKAKLVQLRDNQEYVYQTLSETLNKKLVMSNDKTLKEVFQMQKYFGLLNQEIKEDVKSKVKIVELDLPRVMFMTEVSGIEEGINLLLDVWVYHNRVEL